jgi:hypothetical protein
MLSSALVRFLILSIPLCYALSAEEYHPEYGQFAYTSDKSLNWESSQGKTAWKFQVSSEGYLIWQEESQGILWAWPEGGGRSYLFQGAQWFPFILLEKSTSLSPRLPSDKPRETDQEIADTLE